MCMCVCSGLTPKPTGRGQRISAGAIIDSESGRGMPGGLVDYLYTQFTNAYTDSESAPAMPASLADYICIYPDLNRTRVRTDSERVRVKMRGLGLTRGVVGTESPRRYKKVTTTQGHTQTHARTHAHAHAHIHRCIHAGKPGGLFVYPIHKCTYRLGERPCHAGEPGGLYIYIPSYK